MQLFYLSSLCFPVGINKTGFFNLCMYTTWIIVAALFCRLHLYSFRADIVLIPVWIIVAASRDLV